MTTEVNSQNTTASLKELYLKKVGYEEHMKQVNLDSKLLQAGLEVLKADKRLPTGQRKVNIHDTGLLQSLEDY